ncbi:AT-rich interactive domain-containing protein 5B [Megalops cyprinoides]|uniref:AT-rich interactive domain-containing protein 5B n=1 Tax=Megalops cyprinoides TaxID=118141 RepID=UPI00186478AA|nr:AT-rich interactive domain-containing protein 5B [Megalops cyprinoides]
MERNAIQWLGAPCCLRGSFAFYKSFSCRAEAGHQGGVWRLGEFYFVRFGPQEPVCIAELALLWEDRAQRHLLASSRLYFLPEDTPKGRTGEHGEDEVLAVSKKIVIRVEDLVKWTCLEPSGWKGSSQKAKGTNGLHRPLPAPSEQKAERGAGGGLEERERVKVLSYPQYCRYRSLQRRIQDRLGGPSLQDPHLLALGGIRVAHHNTLVLYCRDTFNHPTLDSNTSIWTQLGCSSLSLKGRPRKRRGRDGKGVERQQFNQSESWIERMKENVMGSVEVPWEGGWLPHPEEQPFLDQLYAFMERRGSPISKVPNLGFKKIDLFLLFSVVKRLGGYERVTSEQLWKQVYNELGGSPGSTSAATCTRRHYEKLILAYEQHLTGEGSELSKPQPPAAANRSKETQKGRGGEANQKEKKTNNATGQGVAVKPKVTEVRRRGRPPSRRHAKAAAKPSKAETTAPQVKANPGTAPAARPVGHLDGSTAQTPLSVFQELNLGNLAPTAAQPPAAFLKTGLGPSEDLRVSQPLASSPLLPPQTKTEPVVKLDHVDPLSPSSLSALTRLHMAGPLGGFSLPKGLSPLDLFRARLGLATADGPGVTPPDSPALQPSLLLFQPKSGSPETHRPGGEDGSQKGPVEPSDGLGRDGRPRAPLPPLRILPLDIDCSLQVRQLMRTRLGSSQFSSFTKKLTEVLAQDLSKARQPGLGSPPAPPAGQEQSLPLNLSKRCTSKRPADDATDPGGLPGSHRGLDLPLPAKRAKTEWEGGAEPLKHTAGLTLIPATQDEPADLSCPRRARASLQERAGAGCERGSGRGEGGGTRESRSDGGAACRGSE